jgi:hypothetical protein
MSAGQWVGRSDFDRRLLDEHGLNLVRAARVRLLRSAEDYPDLDLSTFRFTIEGREGPTLTAKATVQLTEMGRLRLAFSTGPLF